MENRGDADSVENEIECQTKRRIHALEEVCSFKHVFPMLISEDDSVMDQTRRILTTCSVTTMMYETTMSNEHNDPGSTHQEDILTSRHGSCTL